MMTMGTAKEVAWAEKIRDEWLAACEEYLVRIARLPAMDDDNEELTRVRQAMDLGRRQVNARWWIKTRGMKRLSIEDDLLEGAPQQGLTGYANIAPVFADR